MSPPPPYSDYINQKENRFFGSETSLEEENSCKKIDYPDVVLLETKRLCSVSEIKAKVRSVWVLVYSKTVLRTHEVRFAINKNNVRKFPTSDKE